MGGPGSGVPGLSPVNRTSDAKVAMMRRLRALGWTGDEIARELGVCRDTVYRLTNKERSA